MNPINKLIRFIKAGRSREMLTLALARAAATAPLRQIDESRPQTWEFRGFSQHGEDGITDFLFRRLLNPAHYFAEIGIGDGTENNTTWFCLAHTMRGLMIDGNPACVESARYLIGNMNHGVVYKNMFVTVEGIGEVMGSLAIKEPDIFSLDIDGNDLWVGQALLQAQARPKIWIVEYNSAFGPEASISIPYQPSFQVKNRHADSLYFGCSLGAWRKLFGQHDYIFAGVESTGTNAFFIDPSAFKEGFSKNLRGLPFAECTSHSREYGAGWEGQFALIADRPFVKF